MKLKLKIKKSLLFIIFTNTFCALAIAQSWESITEKARGQTVYFNAWGGGEAINDYIKWAGEQTEKKFGIKVIHVKITDSAEVVKRIKSEYSAGRKEQGGSVDLIWVNGENFRTLKHGHLLYQDWSEKLPNWQLVDLNKPVREDFSESTDGLEAPWGTAQFAFIVDSTKVKNPPDSALALLEFAKNNKGRISYPQPPNFHGTTFLKQILAEVVSDKNLLKKNVKTINFPQISKPLWDYLDKLHPFLWRAGKAFPTSIAQMHQQLADGELLMSMTFNPNEGANLIINKQLPETANSFGFKNGTISNIHFVAIPINSNFKEAAQVFANFLLSPIAQAQKADISLWGDPTVLDINKLPAEYKAKFSKTAKGALAYNTLTIPEPHASWAPALEEEWVSRYGK